MNYQETCEYLYNQMPMFERQGASGYKAGLANTLTLDERFRHPHRHYATIHVAGTNGKGSVSHTLAAVLQQCGYRVGLYTSPHLADFRERIRVNGQPVSEEYVIDFVSQERSFFEPLHPSFFEVTTAMALKYFMDQAVDIAVIEVGLGGRLDCTNIITPVVSVITNISLDHTQFLGNTLSQIAGEKAGIIKRGVPVVIGETHAETRPVFEEKAKEMDAPITFAEDNMEVLYTEPQADGHMQYMTRHLGGLSGDLGGIYQGKNLNTVLTVLNILRDKGFIHYGTNDDQSQWQCPELKEALQHVTEMTGLMGRWQIIRKNPLVVCDTGHNVGGWQYLSLQLQQTSCRHRHIVFGMVDDKDIDGVLKLLPKDATYYFTKADSHRALPVDVLQTKAAGYKLKGLTYPTVEQAYRAAIAVAQPDDLVFVGGSSYVVGDFLRTCR